MIAGEHGSHRGSSHETGRVVLGLASLSMTHWIWLHIHESYVKGKSDQFLANSFLSCYISPIAASRKLSTGDIDYALIQSLAWAFKKKSLMGCFCLKWLKLFSALSALSVPIPAVISFHCIYPKGREMPRTAMVLTCHPQGCQIAPDSHSMALFLHWTDTSLRLSCCWKKSVNPSPQWGQPPGDWAGLCRAYGDI